MLLRKFRKDLKKKYIQSEGPNSYHLIEERLLQKVQRFFTLYLGGNPTFSSVIDREDRSIQFNQQDLRNVKYILLVAPTMRKRDFSLIPQYLKIVKSLTDHYINIYQNNNDILLRKFFKDQMLRLLFQEFILNNFSLIDELD